MHVCERCGLREMTDVCSDLCVVCICLVSRPVSYVYYLYLQLNTVYARRSAGPSDRTASLIGHRTASDKGHRRRACAAHSTPVLDSGTRTDYCPTTIDHLKRRRRHPATQERPECAQQNPVHVEAPAEFDGDKQQLVRPGSCQHGEAKVGHDNGGGHEHAGRKIVGHVSARCRPNGSPPMRQAALDEQAGRERANALLQTYGQVSAAIH